MDPKDAALLVIMFAVFGVPAMALGARLAIRPIVDAIVRLRSTSSAHSADARVSALEEEVSRLTEEVHRLSESEAFNRQLLKPTSTEAGRG